MAKMPKYHNPKYLRTRDTKTLVVDRFFINGKQVCYSWWGSDDHPREMCRFLLCRHFGTVDVCGLLGRDVPSGEDDCCYVHDECPLKDA